MGRIFTRIGGRPLAVIAVVLCCSGFAAAQTRVMALGDSITQGGQGFVAYRYPLWFDLRDGGYNVDFVGRRNTVNGGDVPGNPDITAYPLYYTAFDRDHEGYWGWRTDEVADIVVDAATAAQPEVVLIHLGTNDIGQLGASGVSNADTFLRLIITRIRSVRPNVILLLAQIVPIGPGSSYYANAGQVGPLNAVIANIAAALNTPQSPIILVDQNSGFDVGTMMQGDGLHPNLAGEARMASVWYAALAPLLTPGNVPPTVSITAPPDGAGFAAPANITVTADAADADGTVTQVQFFAGATPIGTDTTSPYSTTWEEVPAGDYRLTAVATDNGGATRTSLPINVTVSADGVPVSIVNPSFEAPALSDGSLAEGPGVIQGWSFEASANTYLGIFNPPAGSYPAAGGNGTPAGAHGANAAYLFNNGGPAEFVGGRQILAATLGANTSYTLRVAIGRFLPDQPYAFSTYGGYRIELLAGGTVVASDADTVSPNAGEFREAVAFVAAPDIPPVLVGQPLGVRLTISATDAPRSTHFDNVRLGAREGVPVELLHFSIE